MKSPDSQKALATTVSMPLAEDLGFYQQSLRAYRQPIHRVLALGADKTHKALHQLFDRSVKLVVLDNEQIPTASWVGPLHSYAQAGWDGGLFDVIVSAGWMERDPEWDRSLTSCAQLVRPRGLLLLTSALPPGPVVPVLDSVAVQGEARIAPGRTQYHGVRQGPQLCLEAVGYPLEYGKEMSSSHDADADGVVRLVRVRPPGRPEVVGRGHSSSAAAEQALVVLGLRKLLG